MKTSNKTERVNFPEARRSVIPRAHNIANQSRSRTTVAHFVSVFWLTSGSRAGNGELRPQNGDLIR